MKYVYAVGEKRGRVDTRKSNHSALAFFLDASDESREGYKKTTLSRDKGGCSTGSMGEREKEKPRGQKTNETTRIYH